MSMATTTFDIDATLQALREGKNLIGKNAILTLFIKRLTEAAMQAKLDEHLVYNVGPNRTIVPRGALISIRLMRA
jgi:hypothetical protein